MMRTNHRNHNRPSRSGSITAICLSAIALAVSIFALVWTIVKSGPDSTETEPVLGKGLKAYDFSTPEKALFSQIRIEKDHDIQARKEIDEMKNGERRREQLQTMEVRNTKEFDLRTLPKSKYASSTNDEYEPVVKLLFIHYEREGKRQYAVHYFQKHKESGLWFSRYVSTYRWPKDIKKEISDWTAKSQSESKP